MSNEDLVARSPEENVRLLIEAGTALDRWICRAIDEGCAAYQEQYDWRTLVIEITGGYRLAPKE